MVRWDTRHMPRGAQPDPLRDHFVDGARILLARAYRNPGTWQSTRLVNPGPRATAYAVSLGINPLGPDNASTVSARGGLDARSRWARAFVRCLYDQHKFWADSGGGWRRDKRTAAWYEGRSLTVEVGRALAGGRQAGTVLQPGRAIRVMYRPGNRQGGARGQQSARRYASRLPERDRSYDEAGRPGPRFSDISRRDWGGNG